MRFRRIKFHNYRCFLNGEIVFNESNGKNINLIIGNNGAGKTEVLFAFWWVLYNFNFRQLRNKEATPYAINQTIYKALSDGEIETAECFVEVEIEEDKTIYIVKRQATYKKVLKDIETSVKQSIRYYKENYELSLPVYDEEEINKILNRILPKPILNGIVFDGERMKQLSSLDDNSAKAIAGVINDITNVELYELGKVTFEQIQKSLAKKSKMIAKQSGNVTLNALISEINTLQGKIDEAKRKQSTYTENLNELRQQFKTLSLQLDDIKEAKQLEKQRKEARAELAQEDSRKQAAIDTFITSISDGYLSCCEPLFADIEKLLVDYDVPADLTVLAANNILKRHTCICGTAWTEEMIEEIKSLIRKLPPDNINSAMGEKVHQLRLSSRDKRKAVKGDFDLLNNSNNQIKKLKERIASLSAQIANSGSEAAEETERKYQEIQDKIIDLRAKLQIIEDELPGMEKELDLKKKQKTILSQGQQESLILERENAYVEKCITALGEIKKANRLTALRQINSRLQKAYSDLGDDYDKGRRIYLVQYDDVKRFQIVTYSETQYQETLKGMMKKGIVASLKAKGQSDEEIQETVILSCVLPNSTGQSKINTLSFVKAILDFAHEPLEDNLFETRKEYPLLIDAPFGDIFDINLENSAKHLHSFSHQIILMLAKDSYKDVEDHIAPYVNTVHLFEVEPHKGHSNISKVSLEVI